MGDFNEIFLKTPVVIDNVISIKRDLDLLKEDFLGKKSLQQANFLCYNPDQCRKTKIQIIRLLFWERRSIIHQKEEFRGLLKLDYPIQNGVIQDWQQQDLIWKNIFKELKISPKEFPLLLTESPFSSFSQKQQICKVFFENYSSPAFFLGNPGVLSLYASGKITGIVLDIGESFCQTCPVFDGYALSHSAKKMDLAGRRITEELKNNLRFSGYNFTTSAEFEIIRILKENRCVLSQVPLQDDKIIEDRKLKEPYFLPDGQVIELSLEKQQAPEILFNPQKVGIELSGVQILLNQSINSCDIDLRKALTQEIVLSGGTTKLQRFPERLLSEMKKLVAKDLKIKIFASPDRQLLPWIGGSILTNLGSFKEMWISKKEWEEEGERMILKKTIQLTFQYQ